jgi:carbamoyltransferase
VSTPVNYIGLSCTRHDPSLAIVNADGVVVFAEAAERYLQSKQAFMCQPDHIHRIAELLTEYCDPKARLVISKNWKRKTYYRERFLMQSVALLGKLHEAKLRWFQPPEDPEKTPSPELLKMMYGLCGFHWHVHQQCVAQASENLKIQSKLINRGISHNTESRDFNHHLTHAATGCFTSPFEEAVCAIVDGFGEGTSTSYFHYKDGRISRLKLRKHKSAGSLGVFYGLLCELCGFDSGKGEEWKVMGLAAYGKHDPKVDKILRPLVSVDGFRIRLHYDTRGLDSIRRMPGTPALDAADLAHTGQRIFEDVLAELFTNLHGLGLSDRLVWSGGCALNSVWNGKILDRTPFKELHVHSAPGDDGCSLGAALLGYQVDHPDKQWRGQIESPYLGSPLSAFTREQLARYAGDGILERVGEDGSQRAAELLAEGKVVGFVQGRAEFGPRALGNRSILADPRNPAIRDIINERVKHRESFRPFAPAILHEHGPEYFENYQLAPYMERALQFKQDKRAKVPGVVHADGSGRVQSVTKERNPQFHALIESFYEKTGVPLVLNTSFNIMGRPIMHSVEDAVGLLFTTGLDALVIDDYLLSKPGIS